MHQSLGTQMVSKNCALIDKSVSRGLHRDIALVVRLQIDRLTALLAWALSASPWCVPPIVGQDDASRARRAMVEKKEASNPG